MASSIGFVKRQWKLWGPSTPVQKKGDALKVGILGAANIAPMALIAPAKSHAEVIVQAVAARDRVKAEAFAKKHSIPQVLNSYQAILDDPAIDVVYIPLPNGLHYEWTLKALAKGKHVLVEKPSCSNATEAERLFHHAILSQPSAPVLMEAWHYRYQPSWRRFLGLLDRPNIEHAHATMWAPGIIFSKDDIRFNYELAGGAMNDMAGYPASALRDIFGEEPEACIKCEVKLCPPPRELCDESFRSEFRFPGGRIGSIEGNLRDSLWKTLTQPPLATVKHRVVRDEEGQAGLREGQERLRVRTVTLRNFVFGVIWHSIDVEDEYILQEKASAKVIKRWKEKQTLKAYTWDEMGVEQPSEPWWPTYRYQLEAFVDRIRGRPGSGVWLGGEDSINEMNMISMAYEKSGLPQRPTSEFRLEAA